MFHKLAGIGLRGKSAAEHPEDDDAKAAKSAEEHEDDEDDAKAKAKAKAKDDDEDHVDDDDEDHDAKDDDDEDEHPAAKAASQRRLDKAVKAASAKAKAKAVKIAVLCNLAKRPELTDEFIASGASAAAVGERLLSLRADDSQIGEIAGQTSPAGSPAAAAAMWDHATKKNSRFFGHA